MKNFIRFLFLTKCLYDRVFIGGTCDKYGEGERDGLGDAGGYGFLA